MPVQALALESPILRQFAEGLEAPLRQIDEEWRGELTLFGGEGRKVLICRTTPLPSQRAQRSYRLVR